VEKNRETIMKIRRSQLKSVIQEVLTEAKAQFGGEVIDARDLPEKMQRKVSDIIGDMGLRSSVIEDDLKGKWIYIVFKGGPEFDLGRLSNANSAGADLMLVKGKDVALAVRQR
jgi:hypothetical protein